MHIVLANEIADVDLAEFEKVGSFHEGVIAVPLIDVSLGIKGQRTSSADQVEECQNSLFLIYEAPGNHEQLEVELTNDPLTPGIIYRRTERDYVELQYKAHLAALVVYAYFLVSVDDCAFAYQEKEDYKVLNTTLSSYANLWKTGLVRGVVGKVK